MENKHTDTEALETLIKAVQTYQEELLENRRILINAANVCDAAMGSDDIVKKHIARLSKALEKLEKTSEIAEEVAEALLKDKEEAENVYED